jgi:hypothetical protein
VASEDEAMKPIRYNQNVAKALLPLLQSIGREIEERNAALEAIEKRLEVLDACGRASSNAFLALTADAAEHRRELRYALEELNRLGCSVVGTTPLTIRIPGRRGQTRRSFVYQTGDAVLR